MSSAAESQDDPRWPYVSLSGVRQGTLCGTCYTVHRAKFSELSPVELQEQALQASVTAFNFRSYYQQVKQARDRNEKTVFAPWTESMPLAWHPPVGTWQE